MADKVSLSSSSSSQPLLVVGSVAFDTVRTPSLIGERILGGSASYASIAASFFTESRMVGVVGNDFSDVYEERFRKRGIDLEGLQRDESGPTFFWEGKYHENFNRRDTLDIQLNVFEKFRPDLPEKYKNTPFVLLGNIHPALQSHVLGQLSGNPFVIADTIDLWIDNERDALQTLIKRIDCFVINDTEALQLTGKDNIIEAGATLLEEGPKMAIIKKGEHGAYLFHENGTFALPAYPVVNLQDPTGAGDTFAGSLLGYLAAINQTDYSAIKKAMVYATVTASLTVESLGCDRLESAGCAAIEKRHGHLIEMISL